MSNRKCKKPKLTKEVNASPTEAYFPTENPVPTSSPVAKTHIRWSEKMEEVMLNALYEEVVQNGRRDDNGLKTESMRAAADVVNFTLKMQVTSEHVRTRLKTLKKDYFIVRELLDHSCLGFTFDTENKIVVATEEDAWERYFEAHPDLRHLRDKLFPYFEQLSLIIGNGKFKNLKKNKKTNASRMKAYLPIDNPVPTSSQVGKTHIRWSKKMEEVMVNTLYEEVIRNGKRADNGLKTKSLRAAANIVNFSLKMQVTSEHVRTRLKTLKKDYRIVRELLDHSCFGFTFDIENKIIVAAKEDAWERYFQAHPDSRHLRGKHFPYFEQLSLIMGNEKFKDPIKSKKAIVSPTKAYFPTDNPVTSSQVAKTHIRWSKKMDEVMVNALYGEVIRNGKRADNGLKTESMRATADIVNFTLNMQVTSEHVRTRLKTLKKGHRIVKECLDLSGFGFTFDTENNIIVAAKEDAWEHYFQAHPNSRHLRGKRFPYFEQLNVIVGNEIANGKFQATVDEELVEDSLDCSVVGDEIDTDSDTELADGTGLSSYETIVAANASFNHDAPGMHKTSPLVDPLDLKRKKSSLEPEDFIGNEITNGEYQTTVVEELAEGSRDCSVIGDEMDPGSDTELADGTGLCSCEPTVAANASFSNDAPEMDPGSDTELADGTGLCSCEATVAANASFSNDAPDMHKTSPLVVPLNSKRKKSRLEPQDFMIGTSMSNRKCKKPKMTKEANASPTEAYFPTNSPAPTSSQVANTHLRWSPKMEEVMLNTLYEEVVQNGRRDDNGLKTESMRAAADVVNFTLNMQVTSEHVRARLRTLMKDYHNVRELLDLSSLGFTFDTENKIVVAAEEDAWERYFQAHPDSRYLHGKHFPYFEQLSFIIGNGKLQNYKMKRKTNSSPMEAYFPTKNPVTPLQVAKTHIRWSKKMEEVMVNTLYEEVIRNGKRADNGLKTQSLRVAADAVNLSLKMQVTSEHVRTRLKTLKKGYRIVRELLDLSDFGFTFDTEYKIVAAAEEDAWERYFQAHPNSRHLRGKRFPYFEQLNLIVGNEIANGKYQTTVDKELAEGSPDCSLVGDEMDTDSDIELADGTGLSSYGTTVAANASLSNNASSMHKTSPLVVPPNLKSKKSCLEPHDLMGNEIANGEFQTTVDEEVAEGSPDCSVVGDGTCLSSYETTVAANASLSNDAAGMHKTSPPVVPPHSKRKKSRLEPQDFMMSKYAQGIMDAIQTLAEAFGGPKIDDITAALKPICNGDKHLYLKGLDYLGVDNKQAKIFLAMDSDLRLGWLVNKLQYVKPFNPNECADS